MFFVSLVAIKSYYLEIHLNRKVEQIRNFAVVHTKGQSWSFFSCGCSTYLMHVAPRRECYTSSVVAIFKHQSEGPYCGLVYLLLLLAQFNLVMSLILWELQQKNFPSGITEHLNPILNINWHVMPFKAVQAHCRKSVENNQDNTLPGDQLIFR